MYCIKCGKELNNNVSYCAFCGTKTNHDSNNRRSITQVELTYATKRVDEICKEAYSYFKQSLTLQAESERLQKAYKSRCVGWWIGLVFFITIMVLIVSSVYSEILNSFGPGSTMFAILAVIAIILVLTPLTIISFFAFTKKILKSSEALKRDAEQAQLFGEQILKENINLLRLLPSKYWYPMATEYIAKLFESNRVDTIRQALNSFDEQKHRWTVEDAYANMLEQQRQQIEILKEVQSNTRIAAIASEVYLWTGII